MSTRKLRTTLLWLGLFGWVMLPLLAVWVIARSDSTPPRERSDWAPISHVVGDVSQRVTLKLEYAAANSLFAPDGWGGLVDAVQMSAGQRLQSGSVIATVGGIDRAAMTAERPIGRILESGQRGADVLALNEFLRLRNLPASPNDVFGSETGRGVSGYARSIGIPATTAFDPSWVVFVPKSSATIGKVLLQQGMRAPTAGTPIAELTARLAGATWAQDDPGQRRSSAAPALVSGSQLFLNGKLVGALTASNTNDAGLVGDELLAAVAAAIAPGADTVEGVVISPAPPNAARVPAAAIYSDERGNVCVRWRGGVSRVVVVDSTAGEATVTGIPPQASRVRLNPVPAERRSCNVG